MARGGLIDPDRLLALMKKHKGKQARVAEEFGVSGPSVSLYLKRHPEVQRALIQSGREQSAETPTAEIVTSPQTTNTQTVNTLADGIQWVNDAIEKVTNAVNMLILCERRCSNTVNVRHAGLCKLSRDECPYNAQSDALLCAKKALGELEELRDKMVVRPERSEVLDAIIAEPRTGGRVIQMSR